VFSGFCGACDRSEELKVETHFVYFWGFLMKLSLCERANELWSIFCSIIVVVAAKESEFHAVDLLFRFSFINKLCISHINIYTTEQFLSV
jgi:hypothetical protein